VSDKGVLRCKRGRAKGDLQCSKREEEGLLPAKKTQGGRGSGVRRPFLSGARISRGKRFRISGVLPGMVGVEDRTPCLR